MRAILPMIVLIITHQVLILLLIGLASGVGALAGGGALGGIAVFVLGLGALVPVVGLIAVMRRLGVSKRDLERAATPAVLAAVLLILPVVPFLLRARRWG